MANPWFRLYAEFAHDPKVQMLSEAMQRRYVMLLCFKCNESVTRYGCVTVTEYENQLCFSMRISEQELQETKSQFISKGFIDDEWNLLNWDKRQKRSDIDVSGAERQRKYREKQAEEKRNALRNGSVTLPDVDVDVDVDKKKSKRDLQSLPAFLLECKSTDVSPIPETDPIFDYAKEIRLPVEYLDLQWREFKSRYSDGLKKYKDWRKVYRNSVRDNWFKLWFIDGQGNYTLTTTGQQAKRLHKAAA